MVSDENHEFLFDVTARSKSRANSEISELLMARRMDITVWMSSPNDEVPAARSGATRVARGGQRTVPGGPRWQHGLWFTSRIGGGASGSRGLICFPQDRGS
ncbi:hypothetical protein EVAR_62257_1 [Eumeta japonica]|uniref:Uncharacterized protein n=1 Tax=Eumeta variegata TaxID=151549 RepID=A0A4C1ZK39_EUMVA|nr:hypothetical protein EVAR_62257_1 [Eumeta japonica]